MRFKAPKHASSVQLSNGESYPVVDGIVEVPDDKPAGGLAANGFEPIAPDPTPAKAEPKSDAKPEGDGGQK